MDNPGGGIRVEELEENASVAEVRGLFLEYADSLGFDLCFQDFETEIRTLPGGYAPPGGAIFVAYGPEGAIGCVGVRRISRETAEIKRLYVRPPHRGKGIGRRLADAAVALAKRLGYRRIRLDTLDSMTAANTLYRSMGFNEIEPYRFNPIEGAIYLELDLPIDS